MRWSPGSVSKSEVKRKVEPTARLEKSRLARFAKKSGGDSGSRDSKRSKSAVGDRFVIAYVLSIRIPACPPFGPRRAYRGTMVADQGIVEAPSSSTVTWICNPVPLQLGSTAGPLSGFASGNDPMARNLRRKRLP